MAKDVANKVLNLSSRHGLFSLIYGDSSASMQYGPLGNLLRRNLVAEWWLWTLTKQRNIYGTEDTFVCDHTSIQDDQTPVCDGKMCLNSPGYKEQQYRNVSKTFGQQKALGIAQHRKCILNSGFAKQYGIHRLFSPGQHTMMNLSYFTSPSLANQQFDFWQRIRLKWWKRYSCYPAKFSVENVDSMQDGVQKVDIQYSSPWGPVSIETITNHNSLSQESTDQKVDSPVCIEASSSLENSLFVYLIDSFDVKPDGSEVLRLHPKLSPYKVAVTTEGTNLHELQAVSDHIAQELRTAGINILDWRDDDVKLERQFVSFDEKGVNFTIVVNDTTMSKGSIQLRNRDTAIQEMVHITQVTKKIQKYIRCYV